MNRCSPNVLYMEPMVLPPQKALCETLLVWLSSPTTPACSGSPELTMQPFCYTEEKLS